MWLSIKYAAKPVKIDKLIQDELGIEPSIHYNRLLDRFPEDESPEAKRGPDETIGDHYSRLKRLLDEEREAFKAQQGYKSPVIEDKPMVTPEWLLLKQKDEEAATAPPKGAPLPTRAPGQFTSPEFGSAGYGVPPMDRRDPGATMRAPVVPANAPVQTMNEWRKSMGDKGYIVDANGNLQKRRVPAEQPRPRGHDIWRDLVDPPRFEDPDSAALRSLPEDQGGLGGSSWMDKAKRLLPRRKSSAVVNDYIKRVGRP